MKTNAINDFKVDRDNRTISVQREYEAPQNRVWEAYTKSEILDQWWAPKPWKSETKSMDFTPGGQWLYAMVGPEGEKHWSVANFTAITDGKGFAVKDGFTDENGKINTDMPQSQWEVSFAPSDNGTLVDFQITFDEVKDLDETLKMGFKEGLQSAMENLDAIFAKGN